MSSSNQKNNMSIGIDEAHREQIAKGLARLLGNSYILYIKTQSHHWNVTGPYFNTLHALFETQYRELAEAIDAIAERIRALGHLAPSGSEALQKLSQIPDNGEKKLSAEDMVADLLAGNELLIQTARGLFPAVDGARDEATADLLAERMQVHEKSAWVLRSILEK